MSEARPDPEFMYAIFEIFSFDYCDELFWRTDGQYAPLYIAVDCSDVFEWGTADNERFTAEDIPMLRQAKADAAAAGDEGHFGLLYCARKRQQRPQGAYYKYLTDGTIAELFDACGPLRERDILNPGSHPSEKKP